MRSPGRDDRGRQGRSTGRTGVTAGRRPGGSGPTATDRARRAGVVLATVAVALATALSMAGPALAAVPAATGTSGSSGAGGAAGAATPTTITACGTISSPGVYVLGSDLDAGGANPCLNVTAADVTIDGNGNRLFNATQGIRVRADNVTVTDLTVNATEDSIDANAPTEQRDLTVTDSRLIGSRGFGYNLEVENYTGTLLVENVDFVNQDNDAIVLTDADDLNTLVRDSTLTDIDDALYVYASDEPLGYDGGRIEYVNNSGDAYYGPYYVDVNDTRIRSVNNDILVTGFNGFYAFGVNNSTVDIEGVEYTDTENYWGIYLERFGPNTSVTVRDSTADVGRYPLYYVGTFGDLTATNNTFRSGILDAVYLDGFARGTAVDLIGNEIQADDDGLYLGGTSGPAGYRARTLVEGNDINGSTGVYVGSASWVNRIDLQFNTILGTDWGVWNRNTTAGTFVDARQNWWGSFVPGSRPVTNAPFEDPVNSTALADGSGSNVSEGATAGVSNVRFDEPLLDPPFVRYDLSIVGTNSPVDAGSNATVTARVTNDGTDFATGTVTLTVGGVQRDAADVTVRPGGNTTVTLVWETNSFDIGTYRASVEVDGVGDTAPIDVLGMTFGGTGLDNGACDGDEPKGDDPTDSGEC